MLCDEEPLPFLASLSSDESCTTDSSTGTNVSRFLGEEDLIDSLFYTCDITRSGKVSVSKIVEYLKYITEDDQSNENIDLLVDILDPSQKDPDIDLATYRQGTEAWIQKLRLREVEESPIPWGDNSEVFSTSLPGSPSIFRPLLNRFLPLESFKSPNTSLASFTAKDVGCSPAAEAFSPVSIEGSVGTEQHSLDTSTLMSRIADLEFQNRRLVEELKSVRGRLELSEEASAGIAQEEDKMRAERKIHHETMIRLNGLRVEREELKLALSVVTEAKKRIQIQIHEAERENGHLHDEIQKLQAQIIELTSDTEKLREDKEELVQSVQEHKAKRQEACEKADVQATELAEKTCQLEEIQKTITDMNHLNKSLRKEKINLEQHLTETLHELSVRVRQDSAGAEKEKAEDSDEEIMPVRIRFNACSTPAAPRVSICDELKSTILDSPCLHSPLCDKEMDDIFYKQYQPLTFDLPVSLSFEHNSATSLEEEMDVESMVASALECLDNSGRYRDRRAQLDRLVKLSKTHLLSQISKLPDDATNSPVIKTRMQRELEVLAEDMAVLVAAKQIADKRVNKLSTALKRVYEHYQLLEQKNKEMTSLLEAECKSKAMEVEHLSNRLQEQTDQYLALVIQLGEKDQQIVGLQTHNTCLKKELGEQKNHCAHCEETIRALRHQLEQKAQFTPGPRGDGDIFVSKSLSGSSSKAQDDVTTTVCKASLTIQKSSSPRHSKNRSRKVSRCFETSSGNISLVVVEGNNNETPKLLDTNKGLSKAAAASNVDVHKKRTSTSVTEDKIVPCVWRTSGSVIRRMALSLMWTFGGLFFVLLALVQLTSRAALDGIERAVWPHIELRHYDMPPI